MPRKKEFSYQTEKYAFPSRLRKLMETNKTTQRELAQAIGMRPQTVSLYVQGQSFPDVNGLTKIADFFHVSADFLLGRTENKTTNPKLQEVSEYTGLSAIAAEYLHNSVNTDRAKVLELLISHPWVIDNLHKYLFLNIDSVGEWDKDIRAKGGYKVVKGKYERYAPLVDSKAGSGYPVDAALLGDAILLTIEGELRKLKEGIKNGQHYKND